MKSDDLISRKAVLEILYDISNRNYGSFFGHGINKACDVIKHADTAFDKENVIEDLTDWKNDAEKWAAKYDEIGDTDNMDLQDMAARCYVNAIDIVEKGGIE